MLNESLLNEWNAFICIAPNIPRWNIQVLLRRPLKCAAPVAGNITWDLYGLKTRILEPVDVLIYKSEDAEENVLEHKGSPK